MTKLQKMKYEAILNASKQIILDFGIDALTISDLANRLEIGEATIYRYFGSKKNLIIEIAILLWKEIFELIKTKSEKEAGFSLIESFFSWFLTMFKESPQHFRFVDAFDQMIIREHISMEELKFYNQIIVDIKMHFDTLWEKGFLEHSINSNIDRDLFYFTISHMLLGLCKKVATQKDLIDCDDCISGEEQIQTAIKMGLNYIRKEA